MDQSMPGEVIVVGGGVIGLSIAWELVRAGVSVRVLDQGRCGSGASGIDFAALWPSSATKRGVGHRIHRESLWRYREFVQSVVAESGIDVLFARPGRLELLTSPTRRLAAERESEVARSEWPTFNDQPVQQVIDPATVQRLEPNVAVGDLGALVCEATAYVETPALVAALRAAIIRRGGSIQEESPVNDLWIDEGRVRGVVTHRPLPADRVVVSAGARSTELCPELAAAGTVVPVKGQVIVLRPREPLFTRLLKKGKTYMIPAADGRVLVGSTSEPEAGFDDSLTSEARDQLWKSAIDIVPGLAEASLEKQWVGHRPQTLHQAPYLGEVPGCVGLYLVSGHFKIGVAMGPIVGELTRSLLCRSRSRLT